MEDDDDWGWSGENVSSALELFADVLRFLGLVLLAVIRVAVPIAIAAWVIWALFKLTVFLMGV